MQNFIVLDVETSGLNPIKHSLLSLGAVDFATGEEFYGQCHAWGDAIIDDFALGINGFTREQCMDYSKDNPIQLYLKFTEWCAGRELLLAGQQVGVFDIPFLKEIHEICPQDTPKWMFGYRSVDLHSAAFLKFGKSLSLDGILEVLGLAKEPNPHNALTGAKLERDAFKLLLT